MLEPKKYAIFCSKTGKLIEETNVCYPYHMMRDKTVYEDTRYSAKVRLYNYLAKKAKTPAKYSYVIIKENNPYFAQESVLLSNKYKKSAKYAMIEKLSHADGSESIANITYSSDLNKMQETANGYISWYNYPMGLTKNIQGYISQLN